jgi:hypothetical protein
MYLIRFTATVSSLTKNHYCQWIQFKQAFNDHYFLSIVMLSFVRWDKTKPAGVSNLILLKFSEVMSHLSKKS